MLSFKIVLPYRCLINTLQKGAIIGQNRLNSGCYYSYMIEQLKAAALAGGAVLKEGFYAPKNIEHKGAIDLLTQYDKAAEKAIVAELAKTLPGWDLIAEEGSGHDHKNDRRIYIDPIDGTTNFVHGHPFCCVSIGAWEADKPVAGIIYAPILDELYHATAGRGAFLNGAPIRVSDTDRLNQTLLATGFPYGVFEDEALTRQVNDWLFRALRASRGVRRCGAAALDLAHLARGVYGGFWEMGLKSWDVAAGILLIQEAGGRVSTLDGSAFEVESGEAILASNGPLHEPLRRLLDH